MFNFLKKIVSFKSKSKPTLVSKKPKVKSKLVKKKGDLKAKTTPVDDVKTPIKEADLISKSHLVNKQCLSDKSKPAQQTKDYSAIANIVTEKDQGSHTVAVNVTLPTEVTSTKQSKALTKKLTCRVSLDEHEKFSQYVKHHHSTTSAELRRLVQNVNTSRKKIKHKGNHEGSHTHTDQTLILHELKCHGNNLNQGVRALNTLNINSSDVNEAQVNDAIKTLNSTLNQLQAMYALAIKSNHL